MMRRIEQVIKQVIILGAGASKSEGAPLQNELFKEFFKQRQSLKDEGIWSITDEQEKSVLDFFSDFWGIDNYQKYLFNWDEIEENNSSQFIEFLKQRYGIDWVEKAKIEKIDNGKTIRVYAGKNFISLRLNNERTKISIKIDDCRTDEINAKMENGALNIYQSINFPTFEEVLGTFELASLRRESLKGYTQEKMDEIRDDLIFLIAYVLDFKWIGIKHHEKLINMLKSKGRLEETAFVSLNYDDKIDDALMTLPEVHLDYGIDIIHSERHEANKSILLLKIHGSLNWLFCPTCNHIEKQKVTPVHFYKAKECKICSTSLRPVIIPPTYYKEMSNPFIQQIFLKADEILRKAEKIFICGYSFPDADIHIKFLLKRAERFNGKTPEICVINNHQDKTEQQKEEEKQRFTRFFKNKDKIDYTNQSFEDFAQEGIINKMVIK